MAHYKYEAYLQQSDHPAFDKEFTPGSIALDSGVYRCKACGDEIAALRGMPLPPETHHRHGNNAPIRWKLLVYAQQKR
jgi:hypothetical protein